MPLSFQTQFKFKYVIKQDVNISVFSSPCQFGRVCLEAEPNRAFRKRFSPHRLRGLNMSSSPGYLCSWSGSRFFLVCPWSPPNDLLLLASIIHHHVFKVHHYCLAHSWSLVVPTCRHHSIAQPEDVICEALLAHVTPAELASAKKGGQPFQVERERTKTRQRCSLATCITVEGHCFKAGHKHWQDSFV